MSDTQSHYCSTPSGSESLSSCTSESDTPPYIVSRAELEYVQAMMNRISKFYEWSRACVAKRFEHRSFPAQTQLCQEAHPKLHVVAAWSTQNSRRLEMIRDRLPARDNLYKRLEGAFQQFKEGMDMWNPLQLVILEWRKTTSKGQEDAFVIRRTALNRGIFESYGDAEADHLAALTRDLGDMGTNNQIRIGDVDNWSDVSSEWSH